MSCGDDGDCNKKIEDEMLKAWQEKIDELSARDSVEVDYNA